MRDSDQIKKYCLRLLILVFLSFFFPFFLSLIYCAIKIIHIWPGAQHNLRNDMICAVWSESFLAFRLKQILDQWKYHTAPSEVSDQSAHPSDQSARMRRLIWAFNGPSSEPSLGARLFASLLCHGYYVARSIKTWIPERKKLGELSQDKLYFFSYMTTSGIEWL